MAVLRRSELGEGDEVAGGIFYADLAGAVEGGAFGKIDFGTFDSGLDGVEIFDLDIKEGGAFADIGGDGGEIAIRAGVGLVHDFDGATLESNEAELVAFGDFDGFGETEFFDPKRQDGFDGTYKQHGSDFLEHTRGSLSEVENSGSAGKWS